MNERTKYMTFPVVILKDGLTDIKRCVNDAMEYCLYDYYLRNDGEQQEMVDDAGFFYGISWGNKNKSFERGKIIYESIPENSPKTSISVSMIFDFYKNEKSEFEIVTFLAFAAIRSIIQKQAYTKITNDYLIGRMSGNKGKGDSINPLLAKYTSRYQLDKIKQELENNWGLKLYGNKTRGYYVSFKLDIKSLIYQAERRRKKNKQRKLQQEKKKAIEEIKRKFEADGMNWKDLIEDRLINNYLQSGNSNGVRC